MQKYENVGDVKQTSSTTWKWTIKSYRTYLGEVKTKLKSTTFSIVQPNITTNWRFELYPSGDNRVRNNSHISLFLKNMNELDVTADFQFSILDQSNVSIFTGSLLKKKFIRNSSYGSNKFQTRRFLNRVLINNNLILECTISVDAESNVKNNDADLLMGDFEKLLDSEKHSDVTFVIGRKKMLLHKAILSSRSPVFQAMFDHDMKENQQNTVKITDMKWDVFKEMCHYIYAGKVNEIVGIVQDLLIAADKYCIEGLKALCEKIICDQLNMDNALEYLQLARTYNAGHLKPKVYEFVKINIKDLYTKPEFDELDPEIVKEIMGIVIGVKSVE